MTDKPIEALLVGKWSLGFSKSRALTFLHFEFTDREPLSLAIPNDQAEGIAKAILDQAKIRSQPHRSN